ncbi:LacI family DNA-binding transcriptional regulator [Kamptonema cortianum]|nr:LacI family DNA-binding transcriptional regulator [Oscillatoria laete-virens]MDK3158042.1 LacI family DNA-binding transcriptional regulator [Kamptonema cortianum]MDL5048191.1 LacI family DNA-binding transcriptional regulator [Oscillatoria amoena NRMC-F 0135]MDL5053084.1 LacI family DNA-binding transcriptional regulator [Oscillatoria laete-virens NRMC-F 0139]
MPRRAKIEGPVTQADIARVAGVSRPIVSLALSGDLRVAEATRKKVQEIARQLNYHPDLNFDARRLAMRQKSNAPRFRTIGVVWSTEYGLIMENSYHRGILTGIINQCGRKSLATIIMQIPQETGEMFSRISLVDGLIMTSPSPFVLDLARRTGKPISGIMGLPEMPNVQIDNESAVAMAFEHLRAKGHERIGYFGPHIRTHDINARERREAFLRQAGKKGVSLAFMPERFSHYHDDARQWAEESFSALKNLSALVVYNDLMAIGLIKGLEKQGCRVPRDISLVSIDNIEESALFDPQLTTVGYDLGAMGAAAVDMIEAMIQSPDKLPPRKLLPCHLIERDSVRGGK